MPVRGSLGQPTGLLGGHFGCRAERFDWGVIMSGRDVSIVREVDRAIDGVVHAERALLCVPVDALIDRVLNDVTDLEDWDAATACVDRLNERMQLIRAALNERRRAA